MRVLVTGSRDWPFPEVIYRAFAECCAFERDVTLISGACPTGADAIAEELAERRGWNIERHPADWQKHGRAAGPIRNQQMVDSKPDLVLAFILNNSRGASGTVKMAQKAGLHVRVYEATNK